MLFRSGQGSQNGLDVPKPRVTTLLFTGFSGGFTWSRGYEYGYSVGKWGCRFRMNCPGCPRRTPWELSPSGSQLCMDIQVGQTFLGPLYGTILKTAGHPTHWALADSMGMSWSMLRELVMDREAWCAAIMGSQRVGHD